MIYLGNAFSLQMCKEFPANISVETINEIPTDCVSVVGHQDLANILGVSMNRQSIKLEGGDSLIVAQVMGGRLPEGTTVLPEGVSIELLHVTVSYPIDNMLAEESALRMLDNPYNQA
jgi:hypothetical protein